MTKKLLFVGYFLGWFTSSISQTTLSAGDIAIIGVNFDSSPNYELAIVTLVPIAAGTQIRISDYWYNENNPNKLTNIHANTGSPLTSEGSILWVPTSSIPAGSVFKISILQGGNTVSGLPGNVTVTGWTTATGTPSNQGGDNWFIFQGPNETDVTTFVFLFGNGSTNTINNTPIVPGQFVSPNSFNTSWNTSNLGNNTVTYLPPSLTLGTNAIALTVDPSINGGVGFHADNNVYVGIKSGTKTAILTEICDKSKWNTSETSVYDLNPGGANFGGSNPIFNITLSNDDFELNKIKFFPNPTSNFVTIESLNTIEKISVVNLLGQVVLNKKCNDSKIQIDLSDLPNTIYLIKVFYKGEEQTIQIIKR